VAAADPARLWPLPTLLGFHILKVYWF